jgi:hypothetical protein
MGVELYLCLREENILRVFEKVLRKDGENYVSGSFIICTLHAVLFG